MKLKTFLIFICVCYGISACVVPVPVVVPTVKPTVKKSPYQQVDVEEMIRRYIAKTKHEGNSIEGIYTVSASVNKRSATLLSKVEKDRVIQKKDNYARVAILKDWPGSNTEYVEISLTDKNAHQYPIVAEINSLSEGRGLIYKHFEPNGKALTFTFTHDPEKDILDGVYTEQKGQATVTYTLSYLKIYPKNGSN
jgi:hypothetical protein